MIVCVKCGLRMHSMENGVTVERFDAGGSFQLWQADLWECRNCGTKVIKDFAEKPWAQRGQADYGARLASAAGTYPVREEDRR